MVKKFKKLESVWYWAKRFLRTIVPQIPAVIAYSEGTKYAPLLILIGGMLTCVDKYARTEGWY